MADLGEAVTPAAYPSTAGVHLAAFDVRRHEVRGVARHRSLVAVVVRDHPRVGEVITRQDVRISDSDLANELDHWYCCEDPDDAQHIAFCGLDVTGTPEVDVETSPNACRVCVEMDRDDFCPRYGRCPGAE